MWHIEFSRKMFHRFLEIYDSMKVCYLEIFLLILSNHQHNLLTTLSNIISVTSCAYQVLHTPLDTRLLILHFTLGKRYTNAALICCKKTFLGVFTLLFSAVAFANPSGSAEAEQK